MEKTKKNNSNSLSKIGESVFELRIFEVLVHVHVYPYYGHSQVGISARICDVIVENSPLVMYRDFHFFVQIFVKNSISIGELCFQI